VAAKFVNGSDYFISGDNIIKGSVLASIILQKKGKREKSRLLVGNRHLVQNES